MATESSRVLDLLSELIARPSLNPGDTDDESLVGESRVAEYLEAQLTGLGFAVERHPFEPGRENLVARIGPASPTRTLMVEGHMDTVAVAGMTVEPFRAEIRDGRVYGRGACDTKGPIAASLAGLTPRVLERARAGERGLVFVAACAEEKGCRGARSLAEAGVGADEAVVLEPTGLAPVIAHKGCAWWDIRLTGRACHGSQPERGVSAIAAAADLCHFLQRDLRYDVRHHDLLGANTLNVGTIHGGSAANIVPDHCRIEVDTRMLPGQAAEPLREQVETFLAGLVEDRRLVSWTLACDSGPAFSTDPGSTLAQRLDRLGAGSPFGTGWTSDASPLSATCSEIAVFGPGSILQAHTRDEFIELEQLHRGVEFFEGLYLDFLDA